MQYSKTLCTFEYYANQQAVNNMIIAWLNNHNFVCYENNGFRYVRPNKNQYFDYYFKDSKVFITLYFGSPDKPISLSKSSNISKSEAYGNDIIELVRMIDLLSTQNGKCYSEFQLGRSVYRIEDFEDEWKKECSKYRNKYLVNSLKLLLIAIIAFGFCLINKPKTYMTPYTQHLYGIDSDITLYKEETDMTSYNAEIGLSLCIAISASIGFFFFSILSLKSEKKMIAILLLIIGIVVITGGAVVYMLANF